MQVHVASYLTTRAGIDWLMRPALVSACCTAAHRFDTCGHFAGADADVVQDMLGLYRLELCTQIAR